MPLTDIVFDQENSGVVSRGNTGLVADCLSEIDMETLRKTAAIQKWNAALSKWEGFPLKYKTDDGWV